MSDFANPIRGIWYGGLEDPLPESPCWGCRRGLRRSHVTDPEDGANLQHHLVREGVTIDCVGLGYRMQRLIEEDGVPDSELPAAPPWHIDSSACNHGWIKHGVKLEWMLCDCEDPANPWPSRAPGDGPRDCSCFGCRDHEPRWERGKLKGCEYKDHHCDDCHEHQRCTIMECSFGR